MNKEVDINTFYRNNQDDINILYKSIVIKLNELKLQPNFVRSLDFNEFVNFVFLYSDRSRYTYYE
jgi:hypothetical protein